MIVSSSCTRTTRLLILDATEVPGNPRHVILAHPKFVGNRLLRHSRGPHFAGLLNQLITEFGSPVRLVAHPPAASALIPIPSVISVRPVLKVFRVDALPVVAPVPTNLRPVSIPEKEGQAMRKDALLVSAQFTVAGLVQELVPLPTSTWHLCGTGFNVALRERLDVHGPIVSHLNG